VPGRLCDLSRFYAPNPVRLFAIRHDGIANTRKRGKTHPKRRSESAKELVAAAVAGVMTIGFAAGSANATTQTTRTAATKTTHAQSAPYNIRIDSPLKEGYLQVGVGKSTSFKALHFRIVDRADNTRVTWAEFIYRGHASGKLRYAHTRSFENDSGKGKIRFVGYMKVRVCEGDPTDRTCTNWKKFQ